MKIAEDSAVPLLAREALPPFAVTMGVEIIRSSVDRVEAQLMVPQSFANRGGVMHGGAIMAFADILGGAAATLNISPDSRTTTIESKTNFLRAVPCGRMAHAVCIPLHRGRTTMVWQTTISGDDGRPAAIITQTQLVTARG